MQRWWQTFERKGESCFLSFNAANAGVYAIKLKKYIYKIAEKWLFANNLDCLLVIKMLLFFKMLSK